jgi:hypothetical protein
MCSGHVGLFHLLALLCDCHGNGAVPRSRQSKTAVSNDRSRRQGWELQKIGPQASDFQFIWTSDGNSRYRTSCRKERTPVTPWIAGRLLQVFHGPNIPNPHSILASRAITLHNAANQVRGSTPMSVSRLTRNSRPIGEPVRFGSKSGFGPQEL